MNPTTMETGATQTPSAKPKRTPRPLNGVDTPTLFATIDVVKNQTELALFRFRATNRWQQGTHSRSRIESFYGAGQDHAHVREFSFDADHPEVLVGRDNGALPVEILLVALASCLTGGIGNIAAARGVTLYEVESKIEGTMDIQGILGLSDKVRNGYSEIKIDFKVKGDAPEEKLREIVEQSRARSAVYDVLANGTSIAVTVNQG
ncbi:MAG TPA: OsmC family protein [Candidatus Eisenbacteria bacterium]